MAGMEDTDDGFAGLLRLGALGVAIAGTLAVGYEAFGSVAKRREE